MFTDILAGSSFSSVPDMFLLFYVFGYTHMLPVCVFLPPEAREKKNRALPPSLRPDRQTDRQRGRKARGAAMWALGLPVWGPN